MFAVPKLLQIMQYEPMPLLLAGLVLAGVVLWYGLVWWLTRRRTQKTLKTLPAAVVAPTDLTALKQMYLKKIEVIWQKYEARDVTARVTHQKLSRLVRRFVGEVTKSSVANMTLADLRHTKYATVAQTIEAYYEPEFARIETGNVADAMARARKVVQEW